MGQSTISARIDKEDKKAFGLFCSSVGLNTSSVLTLFIKKVIRENRIPFEVSLNRPISKEEGLNAFYKLRKEAKKNNLQNMTLEEINKEIDDARKNKRIK